MNDVNITEIMANIEEMISGHYTSYAAQFEDYRDFWLNLAAEELVHAQWIRDLYAHSRQGQVLFNEKRFNKESLKEMQGRLGEMLVTLRAQTKTMKDALSSSVNIENFILEKDCFEIFETDIPELKALLGRLEKETLGHRNKMKEMLIDYK